jgi:hypothetical protein
MSFNDDLYRKIQEDEIQNHKSENGYVDFDSVETSGK